MSTLTATWLLSVLLMVAASQTGRKGGGGGGAGVITGGAFDNCHMHQVKSAVLDKPAAPPDRRLPRARTFKVVCYAHSGARLAAGLPWRVRGRRCGSGHALQPPAFRHNSQHHTCDGLSQPFSATRPRLSPQATSPYSCKRFEHHMC
jgi:hypothetical protein